MLADTRPAPSGRAACVARSVARGWRSSAAVSLAAAILAAISGGARAADYPAAARALDAVIAQRYAYLEKLPGGVVPRSVHLDRERDGVIDRAGLLHYAEDRLASLADHHAITGSSFADSWAVVPSYADLWIVADNRGYVVAAARDDSPAAAAGLARGDRLVSIGGVATQAAVDAFWHDLGLEVTPRRAGYAVRVLAAGRRDRDRRLGFADARGHRREVILPSLYRDEPHRPPLTVSSSPGRATIRINNSLGDDATIAAFDDAMARIAPDDALVLDLRDTPSGGTATVARAMLGWFVDRAQGYQVHNRPEEERVTGIARQWIEQVLPRAGKHRARLPRLLVGRWTGSMGEGLAIGFAALGAAVEGGPMAGLNGAVEDIPLGDTDLVVKLPTERLMTVGGLPREDFRPRATTVVR